MKTSRLVSQIFILCLKRYQILQLYKYFCTPMATYIYHDVYYPINRCSSYKHANNHHKSNALERHVSMNISYSCHSKSG